VAIQEVDDFHVDFSGQDHLYDLHGGFIGHSDSMPELGLDAQSIQHLVDLWPPAMNDHRVQADVLEQYDVLRESLLERRVRHRVAAVLDDDRLAPKCSDVGQCLDEDARLLD
jgi:hypothetical protein